MEPIPQDEAIAVVKMPLSVALDEVFGHEEEKVETIIDLETLNCDVLA